MRAIIFTLLCLLSFSSIARGESDAITTHWDVRSDIYLMHREIAGPDAAVIIGDSITEGFYWNKLGRCSVVNAGFAGITATEMMKYVKLLLRDGAPKFAIIMLGSNPDQDLSTFRRSYKQIVQRFSRSGSTVIVVSVPPIESEKIPMGMSRSMETIAAMNGIIKDEIAAPLGLEYVDLYSKLTTDGKAVPGSTTDGIHFSAESYRIDYDLLDKALQHQIAVTGKNCAQ
jgi:lysophospholipase L1-like esterase